MPARPSTKPRIVDLSPEHESSYFVCLEDWSEEMAEAGDHKARWYGVARDLGLRVKLALNEADQPVGMIQYGPIELSPAEGEGLFMILCIWVHGHKSGVGDAQRRGIGTALLDGAEADAKSLGAAGMAAWGLHLPVWMKASWFRKHGYVEADRRGVQELVWKRFGQDASPPRWVPHKPLPEDDPEGVTVHAYKSGWCPAANLVYERAKRVSAEYGTEVHFKTVDTSDRQTMLECGQSDAVFVAGKSLQRGAPPSYRTVRRKIGRQLRRARRGRGLPFLLLLALVGACGGSTTSTTPTGSGTTAPTSATTSSTSPASTASPSTSAPTQELVVWFSTGSGSDCAQVSAYSRSLPADLDPIAGTLDQLVLGPTEAEQKEGASAFWSAETADVVQTVQLTDGLLVVDFLDLRTLIPNASASCGSSALLAQLNATTLQFTEVTSVRYTINGSCDTFANWLQRECEDHQLGLADDLTSVPAV